MRSLYLVTLFLSIFIFGSCTAADKAGIKSPIAKETYNQLVQNQKDYDKLKSTDNDIFSKLRDFDQTPRIKKQEIEKLDISDNEKFVLQSKNSDNLAYFDDENLRKLITMKPQNSWFKQSIIGRENA